MKYWLSLQTQDPAHKN